MYDLYHKSFFVMHSLWSDPKTTSDRIDPCHCSIEGLVSGDRYRVRPSQGKFQGQDNNHCWDKQQIEYTFHCLNHLSPHLRCEIHRC
jgi:hypothetical protein